MSMNSEQKLAKRDKKLHQTFHDLAPVWLINNQYHGREESYFFNIIYQHPVHGWVDQRARYDTFNDVFYRMGETRVSEESLMKIQEQNPYLSGSGEASIPNNPANRYN